MSNSSKDTAEFMEGGATVTITRPHRASPPLNGTFDVEIFGGRATGKFKLSIVLSSKMMYK